jgi:hypothetical protein
MTSAASAVEAAVYTALTAGLTLATVYQHAPENAALPVVIIGDLESEPFDTKDEAEGLLSLTLTTILQGEARKPALAIMEEVKAALKGVTLTSGGWTIKPTRITESCVLLPDGITYLGTTSVSLFVTN